MLSLLQVGSILINLGTVNTFEFGFSALEKQACFHVICAAECDETGSQQAVCRSARKHKAPNQVKTQSLNLAFKFACLQVSSLSIENLQEVQGVARRCRSFCYWQCTQFCFLRYVAPQKYKAWRIMYRIAQALTHISDDAGFAAQSLLAALGSVQFVSNVFFAWFVLHERVCQFPCIQAAMHSARAVMAFTAIFPNALNHIGEKN